MTTIKRIAVFRALAGAAALAALAVSSAPAWADSVDGNWCDEKGRTLSIEGYTILTPGGHKTQGDYSRHRFSYVVPNAEPDEGSPVSMLLINENTMRATTGQQPGSVIWTRCEKVS
ncbi:hypothetical protein NK718_09660 [Alsobacter sp. SYSU M60028]|uniref:Secreted protein n=1 Tax=Alsobacter ponti TaxID=2962936 RepID=A0ABT1LBE7_9HYPH|nr:hypothetical protein [Alsobacter ponti]MCP8938779.1 hypothetical protein [Alsobacter ponti]